jgi:hypothetical protein
MVSQQQVYLSFEKPPSRTDIGEFVVASFDVDLEFDEQDDQDPDFPKFPNTDFFISINLYRGLLRSNIIIHNLPLAIWFSRKK